MIRDGHRPEFCLEAALHSMSHWSDKCRGCEIGWVDDRLGTYWPRAELIRSLMQVNPV